METLLGIGLLLLKESPDIIDLLKTLKDNGQELPTQDQIEQFNQARRDRGLEDVRWDNFHQA